MFRLPPDPGNPDAQAKGLAPQRASAAPSRGAGSFYGRNPAVCFCGSWAPGLSFDCPHSANAAAKNLCREVRFGLFPGVLLVARP